MTIRECRVQSAECRVSNQITLRSELCALHLNGTLAIFDDLAARIKKTWPDVEIILRGDAGFYSPKLLNYCERRGYKYILGFTSNAVLKKLSEKIVFASEMFFVDGGSQEALRLFWEYEYKAKKWSHARKVIVKAERLPDGDNP